MLFLLAHRTFKEFISRKMSSWITGEAWIKEILVHKPVILGIEIICSCLLCHKHAVLLQIHGVIIRFNYWGIKHWLVITEQSIFCVLFEKSSLSGKTVRHTEFTWLPGVYKYGIVLKDRLPNTVYISMFWIVITCC